MIYRRIVTLFILATTLSACGIKGDLHLPGEKDHKAKTEKTAP